jgi:hypothetical protein
MDWWAATQQLICDDMNGKMLLNCALLACGVFAPFITLLSAQQVRIQVRLSSEEIDEVTFDRSRATEEQIRRWVLLAQDGPYGEATLSSCIELQADPRSRRFENTRERAQKLIYELDEAKLPPELADVVRYLRRVQSLWYWIDTQQIAFLQTGDVSVLEQKYDDVDPRKSCAKPVDKIRSSQSRAEAVNAACYGWGNCVNAAGKKKIGPYPEEAWKTFLSAYAIQEHIISTEDR